MGEVAQTGAPLLVRDLGDRRNYVPGIRGARCELAVPLSVRDRTIGVFNVESTEAGAFTREDIPLLMAFAGQAAAAIDNARLVADLRRVSEENRQLAQLNQRILQSVSLGIYTLDTQLRISSWNAAMEQQSGFAAEDAVGRNLFSLFPRLETEGFAERVRRVLEQGQAERFRLNHLNLRGELRVQKRRLAPLKDGDGTVGVVVIIEDITDFRRLLDQSIQQEKLAEVGRLSAGIAHEINNPLAVISYGAQLILREEALTADVREMAERIESEAERLATLTGGLLSFSRAQGSIKRWIDLNQVVTDVMRLVRYQFQRQSLKLETELGELPHILADDNRLKQVLINLLLNAAQAMGREGSLRIRSWREGDWVRVDVADTGPGMSPEVQARIFEPFFTTKREGEGTGLGLYVCHSIVREHEGRLEVTSSPGQGTVFHLSLPIGEA
jgi:PAS domain S-box-containing protein